MGVKEQMQLRTRNLALEVISLCNQLSRNTQNQIISKQLVRASCSVGANYRAVSRAKPPADFINKLYVVEEEADEAIFWLELLQELEPGFKDRIVTCSSEMNEILSIVVASSKTAKKNLNNSKN
jgi:four helix bundle protein